MKADKDEKVILKPLKRYINRKSIHRNAWGAVSNAFARTGTNMWSAIHVLDKEARPLPKIVRVVTNNVRTANFLKDASFEFVSNRSIRVTTHKEAALLKKMKLVRRPNGDICIISNRDEE
jgi:hypothetical protein